jgi:hypothetical protein
MWQLSLGHPNLQKHKANAFLFMMLPSLWYSFIAVQSNTMLCSRHQEDTKEK